MVFMEVADHEVIDPPPSGDRFDSSCNPSMSVPILASRGTEIDEQTALFWSGTNQEHGVSLAQAEHVDVEPNLRRLSRVRSGRKGLLWAACSHQ